MIIMTTKSTGKIFMRLKRPYTLNLYEEISGSMESDNVLEGKLLISDLKGTMTFIELLAFYPLAPGFSLEVTLANISQI